MRLKKGVNKKAQTEVGLGTMLLLILGAIALIVVIIGITQGFGFFFGIFGFLPDDLSKMTVACEQYAGMGETLGRTSYCGFNEGTIGGVKGWYDCDYVHDEASKVVSPEELFAKRTDWCASEDARARAKCDSLESEGVPRVNQIMVNAHNCSIWLSR